MVKKISVFITILGLFFVGIPQFNSKALKYNDLEYRFLETNESIEIDNNNYYPIFINEQFAGAIILNWLSYMEINDINILEMQSQEISTFYLYYNNALIEVGTNVFKIRLIRSITESLFILELYRPNGTLAFTTDLYEIDYDTWLYPLNTMILINVELVTPYNQARNEYGEYLTDDNLFGLPAGWYGFNSGYTYGLNEGYNEGYDDGYDYGEAIGYLAGLDETDATGFIGLLGAVFTGLGSLLSIEILPNIHIGAIIAVPLVFGIIFFIIGKKKE